MLRGICDVSVVSGKRKAVKFDLFSLSTYMCRLCHNVGIFSMIILYFSQHICQRADVLLNYDLVCFDGTSLIPTLRKFQPTL